MRVILRRRAHHRRSPDVDEFDRGIRREGVEIAHHEINRRDVVFGQRGAVLGLVEVGQNAGVNPRVQRLHPTVKHLGKSGHVGDVEMIDARVA